MGKGLRLFVKKIVNIARKERDRAAVDRLGACAEVLANELGAVLGVHVELGLQNDLVRLGDGEDNVHRLIGEGFGIGCDLDLSALEIQIAKRRREALLENGGEKIGFEVLCHNTTLVGDRVERVAGFGVGSVLTDQAAVEHFVKRYGKVKKHDVVGLHNDVVDRYAVEGIVDISHQIKDEDFNVVHASDRRTHRKNTSMVNDRVSIAQKLKFFNSFVCNLQRNVL